MGPQEWGHLAIPGAAVRISFPQITLAECEEEKFSTKTGVRDANTLKEVISMTKPNGGEICEVMDLNTIYKP